MCYGLDVFLASSISGLALVTNRGHMNDRSNEIIKQLNRLANNRTLPTQARNKMLEAARHIKDLQHECATCQRNVSGVLNCIEI